MSATSAGTETSRASASFPNISTGGPWQRVQLLAGSQSGHGELHSD